MVHELVLAGDILEGHSLVLSEGYYDLSSSYTKEQGVKATGLS